MSANRIPSRPEEDLDDASERMDLARVSLDDAAGQLKIAEDCLWNAALGSPDAAQAGKITAQKGAAAATCATVLHLKAAVEEASREIADIREEMLAATREEPR